MSKITLTNTLTQDQMVAMKNLLDSNRDHELTMHLRFTVLMDGETLRHPHGGMNRTPRLNTRLTKISGTPRLTQQHLPITVEVLEDFAGGVLDWHGQDIGKAGTTLELEYSFVDHVSEIEGATPPAC